MAVYLVEGPAGEKKLVQCKTKAQAISHIINKQFTAKALKTNDLVQMIKSGFEIEVIDENSTEETA